MNAPSGRELAREMRMRAAPADLRRFRSWTAITSCVGNMSVVGWCQVRRLATRLRHAARLAVSFQLFSNKHSHAAGADIFHDRQPALPEVEIAAYFRRAEGGVANPERKKLIPRPIARRQA